MAGGLRTLVLVAAVALVSCTSSSGPAASGPRLASPSPAVSNPADSKAADFRTRLDLLLGEHVVVIAKESSAARRADEYTSYLRLLTANGSDLAELVRSALGDTAASGFDQLWRAQNNYLVNYTIGVVTHNTGKADGAMSGLTSSFVPQFAQFISSTTQVPPDPIKKLATDHVLEMKGMIDDQIGQRYPRMYAELRTAYAQAAGIGDALAPNITQRFPDKFPGSATGPAVDLRVTVNNLLQEHHYLTTMATSAATGGRASEQAAAATALAENGGALGGLFGGLFGANVGTQFDKVWAAKNAATAGYASAPTQAAKQSALNRLTNVFVTQLAALVNASTGLASATSQQALLAQVEATITVIDDQRSRALARVGADDRSAGASMETVADLLAGAVVMKLRARFGT
jgi:hypothetical protein